MIQFSFLLIKLSRSLVHNCKQWKTQAIYRKKEWSNTVISKQIWTGKLRIDR